MSDVEVQDTEKGFWAATKRIASSALSSALTGLIVGTVATAAIIALPHVLAFGGGLLAAHTMGHAALANAATWMTAHAATISASTSALTYGHLAKIAAIGTGISGLGGAGLALLKETVGVPAPKVIIVQQQERQPELAPTPTIVLAQAPSVSPEQDMPGSRYQEQIRAQRQAQALAQPGLV